VIDYLYSALKSRIPLLSITISLYNAPYPLSLSLSGFQAVEGSRAFGEDLGFDPSVASIRSINRSSITVWVKGFV